MVPGSAQPKVLDRDGGELFQCVKGDPYVLDQVCQYILLSILAILGRPLRHMRGNPYFLCY